MKKKQKKRKQQHHTQHIHDYVVSGCIGTESFE